MSLGSQQYIVACILSHCSLRDQFRAKRVCKKWNDDIDIQTWPEMYTRLRGRPFSWFMYMLFKYPNRPWNWNYISRNPSISFHDIFTWYPNAPWNLFYLSRNPAITWDDITSPVYNSIQWHSAGVSQNPNVTIDIVRQHPNLHLNSIYVACNVSITRDEYLQLYPSHVKAYCNTHRTLQYDLILANPDIYWNWYAFAEKDGITEHIVAEQLDRDWNWALLSANPNITWEFMMTHSEKPWDYMFMSKNPNVTLEIICNNPDKQWNWYMVSQNASITYETVLLNPDLPWDYNGLSLNPNITLSDVSATLDRPWNFHSLSSNPSITWADVHENLNLPWDWHVLSIKA